MGWIPKPYLLIVSNLFCNHRCTYCIQQKSSLDVRLKGDMVDVPAVLAFLRRNRIDRSVKLMGGEATMHPKFDDLMEGLLGLYRKVVITTNLNGKWYEQFDRALRKMRAWGPKVLWNSTYHPAWMEAEVYIERVRALRGAGLRVGQVATTDTADLTEETAGKLHRAEIDWKLQTFTGRSADGRLVPETWADVNRKYPQLYDPSRYIDHHALYVQDCEDVNYKEEALRAEWIDCTTSKFLIGPDNYVYPCHRHLYVSDRRFACGSIHDASMKSFQFRWHPLRRSWDLPCNTKCNPCDFKSVKIRSRKNQTDNLPAEMAGRS